MELIMAPQKRPLVNGKWLFLAGTIDMGNSEDWQSDVVFKLNSTYNIMNPRRSDWDNTWIQSFNNDSFYRQVTWELDMLEYSDIVLVHFAADSKSPISLMELGRFYKKCVVSCEKGFYREGNVEILCERYNVPFFTSLDLATNHIRDIKW